LQKAWNRKLAFSLVIYKIQKIPRLGETIVTNKKEVFGCVGYFSTIALFLSIITPFKKNCQIFLLFLFVSRKEE
jgi:hypothetical protein